LEGRWGVEIRKHNKVCANSELRAIRRRPARNANTELPLLVFKGRGVDGKVREWGRPGGGYEFILKKENVPKGTND